MKRGGFTLLEVMVAVAILALALTAIFSSEAGAIKVAHRARKTTVASLLARCKMGEIEEQVARTGMPAVEAKGEDGCCEGAEAEGFRCEFKIERVVLPDSVGEDQEAAAEGAKKGADPSKAGKEFDVTKGPPDVSVDSLLSGGGSGDLIGEMAMSYAFPLMKASIEEQVRRATVTVKWQEGTREQKFDVVQFLVSEPPVGSTLTSPDGTGLGSAIPGQPVPGSTPGTGTTTGNPTSSGGLTGTVEQSAGP